MNFKLNKIALALPMSLLTLGAGAVVSIDDIPTIEFNQLQKNSKAKAAKQFFEKRYFILLEDEPVALYQGGIKGLKATNIAASQGVNSTSNGKLNVNSSASITYSNYLAKRQNDAIADINVLLNREVKIEKRFKVAINSLVADLEPNEVLALRKMPGVLAVEKEEMQQLMTDVGPQHVGATAVWDNADISGSQGEGLIVGVLDTGISSYTQTAWDASSFDYMTFHPSFADVGVDGYDHTNPNGEGVYFGDCVDSPQWCNDKLIGVMSFEGLTTQVSWDMRVGTGQDDHGHGTHVASTIVGNRIDDVHYPTVYTDEESEWNHKYYDSELSVSISGVAPHANIVSYKTCSVEGCSSSAAIEAIEHAIANNIDVINYSVGGTASSPWFSSDALAFLSAREAGIHTAVAAGNSGILGEKTVGSPGNSPWVTTVAALSHSRDFTEEKIATFSGGSSELGNLIGKGATSGITTLTDIVYAGDVEDASQAETAGGVGYCGDWSLPGSWSEDSVAGKVVICRRGGIDSDGESLTRLSKGNTALQAQAAGMIFINSDDSIDNVENDLHVLPTVHLNKADGDSLLAWLAEGEGHQVSFTDSELMLNSEKADITASFTSRGPDYFTDDYMIPDVGAPGVSILAGGLGDYMQSDAAQAWEKVNGEFRYLSGTSMASPHIAGMYVLMKAAQPNWTPAEAQSALMMTAFTDVHEDDDADGELNRADMHRTGSGSARVNLAINAGLVMNETRAGYEAANPHAEEQGISDDIANWHGQPHQMNLPSLSKGECLISCDWTRTFKATKAGSWTVSFEYYNEGFTLTSDNSDFTVSDGEEVELTFTAEAAQGLGVEWANGRVILTPSDSSMPVQTLPVTVNFIAGVAPEKTEITAKRTSDSSPVEGIMTIGTDDLQVTKSGLVKADVYDFELMRDATNDTIFHYDNPEDQTIKVIPLNIQADSKRLVIEVLETTSPDIDIFVGIDSDLDGKPSHEEMGLLVYQSATEVTLELIDEVSPRNDTYWVLVHNWAEGPALLTENQMLCDEGQEPDEGMECAEAPVMDSVKLSITNIEVDADNMMIETPSSVSPLEDVETRIVWDETMNENDIYHGVFWLGTSAELNKNIGAVRVNLRRGEDDVRIDEPTIAGDKMTVAINVTENSTGEDRSYNFSMELADGVIVDTLIREANTSVSSMRMSAEDVEYSLDGNVLSWSHVQQDGDSTQTFSLVIDTANVAGTQDATPTIESSVNTSTESETFAPQQPVFIEGRPIFSASASSSSVKEGKPVTLSASVVDAVIENPEISYQWTQTSGPTVSISGSGASITFDAPTVSSDETMTFELVGSNGSKSSLPAQVSVNVDNASSGGAVGWLLTLLLGGRILRRNRK